MQFNKTLAALVAVSALCLPAFAENEKKDDAKPAAEAKAAPAFTAKDQAGKEHSLADYKGKIVVLEWTNPGCPFVKKHYTNGDMAALAKKYEEKGVVWLGVDSSNFVTADAAAGWVKEKNLGHAILIDADGKIGTAYGAKTTPHMFVIDKAGNIAYQGAIDDDKSPDADKVKGAKNYVSAALDSLLKGEKPAVAETQSYGCSVKYKK